MTLKTYYLVSNLEDNLAEVEERLWLEKALRLLPWLDQQILILKYMHELSQEDIASELGCSVGTIRNRASRARKKLRCLLK